MTTQTRGRHRSAAHPRAARRGPSPRRRGVPWLAGIFLLTLAFVLAGIWLPRGRNVTSNGPAADAQLLLREVVAAYRNLKTYRDSTRVIVRLPVGGEWVEEVVDWQVQFERPNRLRLDIQRPATRMRIFLASDGAHLCARIVDPSTNDFDQQFVELPAPQRMDVSQLYAATEYADLSRPRELFSLLMSLPTQLQISQLSLLLDESPLGALLTQAKSHELLGADAVSGFPCEKLAIDVAAGRFVLWIDRGSRLLRRLDFPVPASESPPHAQLTCLFTDIDTSTALADAEFALSPPPTARRVRHFVLPPMDDPPRTLNTAIKPFSLTWLLGGSLESARWRGKVAVLCWFDTHPDSAAAIAELQAVHEHFEQDPRVEVVAICTAPRSALSNESLAGKMTAWQATLPVARDLEAVGRDLFGIESTPTLVVIDGEGVVQLQEVGVTSELHEQLPIVLEKLLAGEPLAADYLAFLANRKSEYDRVVAAAGTEPATNELSVPASKIAPAAMPAALKLTTVWRNERLKSAGNLVALVDHDKNVHLFVLDAGDVVELDGAGKEIARHAFANTVANSVTRITMVAPEGQDRRFALWSVLGSQVHLYDGSWQPIGSYPPGSQQQPEIQDVQFADLDEDGLPEMYVGFASAAGLHRVSASGATVWSNRTVGDVLSVTSSVDKSNRRFLLVTNEAGQVIPLDRDGQAQRPLDTSTIGMHHLFSNGPTDPLSHFLGLSYLPNGSLMAVGLSPAMKPEWDYRLPTGVFRTQLQFVASQRLWGHRPQWVLAAADGSIHFLSEDGSFRDVFRLGEELTGFAVYPIQGAAVLVLASPSGVQALQVEQ